MIELWVGQPVMIKGKPVMKACQPVFTYSQPVFTYSQPGIMKVQSVVEQACIISFDIVVKENLDCCLNWLHDIVKFYDSM